MCFDEKTSWLTLGIGSIVNIAILVYLWHEHRQKEDKNLIYPAISLLIFQFCLLMQIPDGLAWGQLRTSQSVPLKDYDSPVAGMCGYLRQRRMHMRTNQSDKPLRGENGPGRVLRCHCR